MPRIKRLALFATGGGFAICLLAVILLQGDPTRMSGAPEFLHRTGMAFMLGGLVLFLGANVAHRHRERLRRASRAVRGWPVFLPETTRALQFLGGMLMALAVGVESAVVAVQEVPGRRSVFLILLGIPGALTWLIGTFSAALAAIAARSNLPPRSRSGEPIQATLVYEEWREPEDAPLEVEAER
jgi:hypothetical protein